MENKFIVLKAAVARAFEDKRIDPEQVLEEYFKLKHISNNSDPNDDSQTDPHKEGGELNLESKSRRPHQCNSRIV